MPHVAHPRRPLRRRSAASLLFLLIGSALLAGGCKGEPPPPPPPEPPPPPPPAILAPRQVTTDAAFDLVATGQGAVLVWAPPGHQGTGIRMVRLNPLGGAFGDEVPVFSPKRPGGGSDPGPRLAIEVAAATGGGRLAVGWVLRDPMELRIGATYGSLSSAQFAPFMDLGKTEPVMDSRERSAVAVAAAADGTASLLYRTTNSRCHPEDKKDKSQCAEFRFKRLGEGEGQGAPALIVPQVCDQPVVGYLWSEKSWYYGICTKPAGKPVTTVYAITHEPEYALAENVLDGRVPTGMAPTDGGMVVVGRGAAEHDIVRFTDAGRRRTHFDKATADATCVDGRPVLRARSEGGAVFTVALSEPRSGLQAMLPTDYATDHARAVWTGKALLVAFPSGGEVVLHRFECVGDDLERTDL